MANTAIFQNKTPPIFTFFQNYLLRNFWYGVRHSMIKSASIVRNLSKNHTFRTIASILIDTQSRFPANFIRSFCDFQSNYSLPEASIHELYSTLIGGGKTHHFFTNRHIEQFCMQNRFTFIWYIALIKCILHTNTLYTFQRGQSFLGDPYFYKRRIRVASILLSKTVNTSLH